MIELSWGEPLSFVVSPQGDTQIFSTPEQAHYWLRRKWPVTDAPRNRALAQLQAAMDCLLPVGSAKRAFISAARSAGFVPDQLVTHTGRPMAG